ncbi:hypothetical protein Tco_0679008 [Tanacetum coccineum]|uniref:Uncharacterized protein n=1 Tax=Tanacetum coccineum TaxID=301880 RepID=A0ABQ4XGN7_9ASTR
MGLFEVDEEAEEEHLAPAYPVVVALPDYSTICSRRLSPQLPIPQGLDSEVCQTACYILPTTSHYLMASIHHQQIPFPLSPPSPVLTSPPHSPIRSLGYRVTTIRMRAKAVATSHSLLLPLPFILSPTRPDASTPLPYQLPTFH